MGRQDVHVVAACAPADAPLLGGALRSFGLPVTLLESATTAAYSFSYEDDARFMVQDAVGASWTAETAVSSIGNADWVYVASLTRTDFPPATLAALAAAGRRLLVDAHGLVRTPELGPLVVDADIGPVLADVTVLKLNDEEALVLTGSVDAPAMRSLGVAEVLLTLGSRGSLIVAGEQETRLRAQAVAGPVDPTGAGDTFSAAYLDARSRGVDPLPAGAAAGRFVAGQLAL